MFESICIPPTYPKGTQFDLGLLAESLIFYNEVLLIVQASSLRGLVRQFNPSTILRFLEHGRLKIKYVDHILGVMARNENTPFATYDIGFMTAENLDLENVACRVFEEATGKRGKGRRLARRFLKSVEPISYQEDVAKGISREIQEGRYISEYIHRRLCKAVGTDDRNSVVFGFGPLVKGGFQLRSNLNFEALSKQHPGLHDFKDPSSILASYATTIADLSLWSKYGTEVAVNDKQTDVLQSRFDVLLNQRVKSDKNITNFQEFLFDDARVIKNAINTGT
jgi:hypothetical protein